MKRFYLLFLVIMVSGCTEKVIEKPENLISERQMVDIYFDVALFNASKNSGYDKFREHAINSRDYIYNKYGIDSLQLANSGTYYAAKPVLYEKIYERVEERLDSLKRVFDKEIGGEDVPDSREDLRIDSLNLGDEAREKISEQAKDTL